MKIFKIMNPIVEIINKRQQTYIQIINYKNKIIIICIMMNNKLNSQNLMKEILINCLDRYKWKNKKINY
jgi:hypothetical protein